LARSRACSLNGGEYWLRLVSCALLFMGLLLLRDYSLSRVSVNAGQDQIPVTRLVAEVTDDQFLEIGAFLALGGGGGAEGG